MPRLNYGTLLENVVILEVARLCFDRLTEDDALAFATAFAMPPLTQCWAKSTNEHNNTPAFNDASLPELAAGQNRPSSLREFWALCVGNGPRIPICCLQAAPAQIVPYDYGGPNGALLVAMLASRRSRALNFWINDDGGRYGEVPPATPNSQSEAPDTINYGVALVGAGGIGTATLDPGQFPGTIPSLETWLTQGPGNTATVRAGFLDPDNYTEGQTQVTRDQHQRWLRVLASDVEHTFSVMFFSCQNRGRDNEARNQRLAWFHDDEVGRYPRSLVFEYGNHQTGVKIRLPADHIEQLTVELLQGVQAAWDEWGLRPLTVHVDGQAA